jgi:uncharacterized protein DUF669
MDLNGFDANQEQEWKGGGGMLPEGEYIAVIDRSDEKPNKKGTGMVLELEFQVIEGQHAGATVRNWLSLQNPEPKTVQIARAELAAICKAVGVLKPYSTRQLHDIPLVIRIKHRERKDKPGTVSTEITGYKARAATNGAKEGDKAPWEKTPF